MGRPSKRTPELIAEICERLSKGESLLSICDDDRMPADRTIRDWLAEDKDLSAAYAHARDIGYDRIADNLRKVAKGDPSASSGDVQRDKLIIDTDLRLLKAWDPKRYGDRVSHDGQVAITVTTVNFGDSGG